jgi:glucokinase
MEIWCDVPLEIARRRYEDRHPRRHPIHGELLTDTDWERWRRTAQPLRIGPLLKLDTTSPVDTDTLITWIHQQNTTRGTGPASNPTSEEHAHKS